MEEKIIKILELVQAKDDGTVEFSEESKKLIHEVAEKCRILKIVNAPTQIHMMMAPKLILPVIDDLLQAELSEPEEEV